MKFLKLVSIVIFFLSSCGGGGGGSNATNQNSDGTTASGGGYSISIDKSSLVFDAVINVGSDTKTVTVTFKGDGVIVGYPDGVVPPTWLSVEAGTPNGNKVNVSIKVNSIATLGSFNTTLRFVTGKADGSAEKYVDLPITVNSSFPFLVTTPTPTLKFSSIEGNALPPSQSIHVIAKKLPLVWTIDAQYSPSDDSGWLSLTSPGEFSTAENDIAINVAHASRGVHTAQLSVSDYTKGFSSIVPVEYTVTSGLQLQGVTDKTISATSTLADMSETLQLSSSFDAAAKAALSWTITSDQDWISFDVTTGNFSNTKTINMQFVPEKMKSLSTGAHTVHLTLSVAGGAVQPFDFPFVVNLNLPSITSIYPYVGYAGRSDTIAIYGDGFSNLTNPKVIFGSTEMDAIVENDHLIHVNYPASLSASDVNVSIKSSQVIARENATLKVIPEPHYQSAKIDLSANNDYRKIAVDPERSSLLIGRLAAPEVILVKKVGSNWQSISFPVSNANNAIFSADGKDAIFTTGSWSSATQVIHLDAENFTLKSSATITPSNASIYAYDTTIPLLNGKLLLLATNQWPSAMLYPDQQIFNVPLISSPITVQSPDRSLLLVGEGSSSNNIYSLTAGESSFVPQTFNLTYFREETISMSRDASRILTEGNLYNKKFQYLGSIPGWLDVATLSPDGKRIYGFNYQTKKITSYDTSGATGPYPLLSADIGLQLDADTYARALRVTADGNALIVLAFKWTDASYTNSISQIYIYPLN